MFKYRCNKRFHASSLKRYIPVDAILKIYEYREGYELENAPWSPIGSHIEISTWSYDSSESLYAWFSDNVAEAFFDYLGQFPEGDGSGSIDDNTTNIDSTWSSAKIESEINVIESDITNLESDITNLESDVSNKQDLSQKGSPNGYPDLDATGKVPISQLPSILFPVEIQLNFVDNSTQRIVIGDKTIYRMVIVDYTLETTNGIYYQAGRFKVVHDGSAASFDNEIWSSPSNVPNMSYSADVYNNDIRMVMTASSVGSNLRLKYVIVRGIKLTT